jgi:DNA-binding LacI/PurR family transcriptional regulator
MGLSGWQSLLQRQPHLTAIVACNDLMALGPWQPQGVRITGGQDIAVGGFDDIPAAEHATPSLTTVRQPIFRIGEELAVILTKIIDGETLSQGSVLITPELVVRDLSAHREGNHGLKR